ncbi:UNVERIFIED_CONTAM: putative mitochondrial protein [Sesamum indicum]
MLKWPVATSVRALRGFLGLAGYYRKFIKGYGIISKPFTTLLKKDAFEWNSDAELAFNQLKVVMTYALVLAMPNFTKPFVVETDAFGKGIGVALMQEGRLITYLSKALATKNLGLSTYEKEFLELLLTVTKWKHYLQGNHFIMKTEFKAHIGSKGLSYEVQYKRGSENRAADALSRVGHEESGSRSNAITTYVPLQNHLITPLIQITLVKQAYSEKEEKYMLEPMAWVKECEICQRSKYENTPYPGLLQPLPIPEQTWSCLSMTFIEGLPSSEDRDKVFTSRFWKELFTLSGVSLDMSSAYHPQSDGQTERVNQCLENYLRWLKATPFHALYGYPPQQLSIGPYLQNHHSEVEELMQKRIKVLQLLKDNLHQA